MLVKLFLDTELGEKVKGWFYRNWASMFWAIAGIAFPPFGMAMLVKLFLDTELGKKTKDWFGEQKRSILAEITSLNPIFVPIRLISQVTKVVNTVTRSTSTGLSSPAPTAPSLTLPPPLRTGPPSDFSGFFGGEDYQHGGIVMPRPGGVWGRLAEAGEAEVVSPLSKLPHLIGQINQNQGAMAGGGGRTIVVNLHIQGSVLAEEDIRDLARQGVLAGERRGQENF